MGILLKVSVSIILVFGTLLVMAVLGTMMQSGYYINPSRIKFDASKALSFGGIKRLFSTDSLVELGKSFFKLVILGYIAYRVMSPIVREIPQIMNGSILGALSYLHDRAVHLFVMLMVVITAIAVADILYVRYQYYKGLRMTKQEVKDEHKQMEGDPFIKGRIRKLRIEKARRRMMAKVPQASVVVTNPTHYAVALQYEPKEMLAPVLVAKGPDLIAMRIRKVAEEHDVPIVSNPPLARLLYDTVELDQPVKPEHYRAVAEVISYVYKLKGKTK
jgi:flagellar biosynthesis protein FlhB